MSCQLFVLFLSIIFVDFSHFHFQSLPHYVHAQHTHTHTHRTRTHTYVLVHINDFLAGNAGVNVSLSISAKCHCIGHIRTTQTINNNNTVHERNAVHIHRVHTTNIGQYQNDLHLNRSKMGTLNVCTTYRDQKCTQRYTI